MKIHLARLERWVWWGFLATLAWQTRLILWQAGPSFVEWQSISLYFSDVLILGLLGLALLRGWRPRVLKMTDFLVGLFLVTAILSLSNTASLTVGIYQTVRLAQFILLYFYFSQWARRHFDLDTSLAVFVAGALGQATLAIAQAFLQHDVGLRWLGETLLQTDLRGVAVFYDLSGVKILRAYGTLPHPNVLAAYLILALWALAWLFVRHGKSHRWIWGISGTMLLVALYLTYSRTMVVAWVLASLAIAGAIFWSPPVIRTRLRQALLLVGIISICFAGAQWSRIVARSTISAQDEAVRLRVIYNRDAFASGQGRHWNLNWAGVGIGNFTTWLSRYDLTLPSYQIQPAHNVFLLIYSELGLLGLAAWLAWLGAVIYHLAKSYSDQPLVRWSLLAVLGALIFISLFDHFFWTLQQGRILWWMTLALCYTDLHA